MSVPVERLLSETRRVFMALDEAAGDALVASGISMPERALLEHLVRERRPVGAATLAKLALSPLHEVRVGLGQLHRRGWIDGWSDATGPTLRVVLNVAGRDAFEVLRQRERALLDRLELALGAETVRSTCATLRHVRRRLQRAAALVPE